MKQTNKSSRQLDKTLLDTTFQAMVEEDLVPGLVAFARKGNDVYCKAFGFHDKATSAPMQEDAIFRFYSNSKVFGSAVALHLQSQGRLSLEDPVSKYLSSFNREWSLLREAEDGSRGIEVFDALEQTPKDVRYSLATSEVPMQVKHLLSETSGIGYDFGATSLACNTLRQKASEPESFFSSGHIVGSSLSVGEFCDVIAKAGVLCTEPGTESYGHGATVLGRIVEVIQNTKLSDYLAETVFRPCNIEAEFFFADGDPRVARLPGMYAPVPNEAGEGYTMFPCQETVPGSTNHTDHFAGPRTCESLDTGLCMTVESYAKFFDMLINGGNAATGQSILDAAAVHSLTHDQTSFGPFSYGWEVQPCSVTNSEGKRLTVMCRWGGYASTMAYLFPEEETYIILGQQIMSYTPASELVDEMQTKQAEMMLSALLGEVRTGADIRRD